jgi:hypothetical protein
VVSQVDWPDKSQGQVVKIWVGVPLVTVTVNFDSAAPELMLSDSLPIHSSLHCQTVLALGL